MRTTSCLFLLVVACSGNRAHPEPSPPPESAPTGSPVPSDSEPGPRAAPLAPEPQPVASAVPDALGCGKPLPDSCGDKKKSFVKLPSGNAAIDQSPTAGQMTEQSAAAKRLFDSEKWSDAAKALERVAQGKTGDDAGNRQLAEYYLAIALARLGDWNGAKDLFALIAERPTHLKHRESFLWLSKAASGECITSRGVKATASYDPSRRDFDNPAQQDVERLLLFSRARALMELGKKAEAREAFATLQKEPGYAAAVAECMQILR